jgi:transcription antitermination factor NusG
MSEQPTEFVVGQVVRITRGNFANYVGRIDSLDVEGGIATVMLQIYGRGTPVELSIEEIESASP